MPATTTINAFGEDYQIQYLTNDAARVLRKGRVLTILAKGEEGWHVYVRGLGYTYVNAIDAVRAYLKAYAGE